MFPNTPATHSNASFFSRHGWGRVKRQLVFDPHFQSMISRLQTTAVLPQCGSIQQQTTVGGTNGACETRKSPPSSGKVVFRSAFVKQNVKRALSTITDRCVQWHSDLTRQVFHLCSQLPGQVGDWRNYYSEEQSQRMDNICADKFGQNGVHFTYQLVMSK